jgi:hypothetical protein
LLYWHGRNFSVEIPVMRVLPVKLLAPAGIAFLVLSALPARANVEAGMTAYQAGDYATALAEWRWDASQGNPAALMNLGRMYEKGQGVPADPYTAFVLYRVAFAQGGRQAEPAANRVANLLAGQDLARGLDDAKRLVSGRKYLPPLPGASPQAVASGPAPAAAAAAQPSPPRPVSPPPAIPAAAPAPAAAPSAAPPGAVPAQPAATIEYRYACNMLLRWQDKGSGGARDLALFQAEPDPGFFIIGGHAQSNFDRPDDCTLTLRADGGNLLAPPSGWDRVWKDKGTGAHMDGSIWRARPPDGDHVCLGDVGQTGKDQPTVPQYRCVHRCLVRNARPAAPLWTTENTGAESPLAVYRLPHAKSFIAMQGGQDPAEILDLNPNAACQ